MAGYVTEKYDSNANCYGYATQVSNCGAAVPGGVNRKEGENLDDYFQRLIDGVLKDGEDRVTESTHSLDKIPVPKANNYLMLMLVGETGFHFLRREENRPSVLKRRRWSWKNGCGENYSYWNVCKTNGEYTTITNSNLKSAIQNPRLYVWGNSLGGTPPINAKVCFFVVQSQGFRPERVKAPPKAPH